MTPLEFIVLIVLVLLAVLFVIGLVDFMKDLMFGASTQLDQDDLSEWTEAEHEAEYHEFSKPQSTALPTKGLSGNAYNRRQARRHQ